MAVTIYNKCTLIKNKTISVEHVLKGYGNFVQQAMSYSANFRDYDKQMASFPVAQIAHNGFNCSRWLIGEDEDYEEVNGEVVCTDC